MLLEVKGRIPWQRNITSSLIGWIEKHGKLSDKQMSLISSLYADNCMRSDEDVAAQVECRKLCIRLMQLGELQEFVQSVLDHTGEYPLSARQMKAIRNVAAKKKKELESVPELDENTFDGWFQIGFLSRGLDNNIGK